jgi:GNAT superfamily N-acetyltransferase
MSILIRRAVSEDAKDLSKIAFSAKAHWGYPERWMKIWRSQFDFTPEYFEKNESWVAESAARSIGFYTLLEKNDMAWLENLWVNPENIGKGVGKQLFVHALVRARELGFSKLQCEADPNAAVFYEKMGMYKVAESSYPIEGQERILPVMEILL